MRVALLALLGALLLDGPPAAAQEPSDEARAHFEAAVEAYDRGAYETAEAEFRRAHALSGHPDLHYNVYLAAERAGDFAEASDALERYLAEAEMTDERRDAFGQRLVRLRARSEADAVGGEVGEVAVESRDDELATPVIFVERRRIHPAATALFIAAGALAVSFAVAAGLSEAEDRELAGRCGRDTAFPSCADDELDALRRRNLVADISWVGAAIAATAGLIVLFTVEAPASDSRVSASVGLGGLRIEGSF